jgi:hypothetical protein
MARFADLPIVDGMPGSIEGRDEGMGKARVARLAATLLVRAEDFFADIANDRMLFAYGLAACLTCVGMV